jgi:hypothetical protein
MAFAEIIAAWKDFGIFEFYLPFVLMFAIFYGLLSKSKIFGDPSKERRVNSINIVISIVAALFVMVYTPVGVSLTVFFGTFFTQTMVILVTVLAFALILYMILPSGALEDMFKDPKKYAKYFIPIAAIVALIIFLSAGGLSIFGIELTGGTGVGGIGGLGFSLSSQDIVLIVLIIVFALVIWFITRGESGEKEKRVVRYKSVPVYEGEEGK